MLTNTTPATLDRFLDSITDGSGVSTDLFASDAHLDATVPNWRMHSSGAEAVAAQDSQFFASPGSFEELDRHAFDGGAVITYRLAWEEAGVPYAARHCHVLTFDGDGLIANDRFFCGGRWDAALLAEMASDQG